MMHRNKKKETCIVASGTASGKAMLPRVAGGVRDPRVREESGLTILEPRLRGVLTFPAFKPGEDWLVFLIP